MTPDSISETENLCNQIIKKSFRLKLERSLHNLLNIVIETKKKQLLFRFCIRVLVKDRTVTRLTL